MADSISPSPVAPCKNASFQFIEEMTRNADTMQKDILTQILNRNAETEYLKSFGLNGATERQTFRSKIPTITYEDIQPLIQRIANGDSSPILCADPIIQFLTSSGTSGGEKKLIPLTKEEMDRRMLFLSLWMPVMNEHVKGLDKGKSLNFVFVKSETKTPGGLPAMFALTSFLKSDHLKAQIEDLRNIYTTPLEATHCLDIFQSMYTQMLCGLYEREKVLQVGALFASTLVRAVRFLESNWQQLAHDIRTGSLNPKLVDPIIQKCMARVVKSDPNLADLITRECEKENWEGIISRIWPNAKYLDVIVTGTMAQYIPTLDYYSGGLPIVSMIYGASEGAFGLNVNPMCNPYQISYTIMPNMAYFEFLAHEPESSKSTGHTSPLELVELADVEIGKEYEIVVTTFSGLYRYQIGDILRVTGFYNSAPMFQVVGRKNVLLSVDLDKTYESELQEAMGIASRLLTEFGTGVLEYTSYADTSTIPGHYVVYWELLKKESVNLASNEVLGKCCLAMEESLNSMYRQCRVEDKSVGPLEIRIVKNGTFEELMNYAISMGASLDQYKVPRCVSSVPILKLLDERVVSTHFSPSLPHWVP